MFLELYNKYNYELADPRTNDFLLMTSPFKVLAILSLYLWFCLKAGPHFMKDRKPFQLRQTLVVYNLIQIILSAFFFKETLMMFLYEYDLRCIPLDYSVNPKTTYLCFLGHICFLSKISELLDTVFFVLRKKYSQITTLHLYHHTIMVAIGWVVLKYMAGGQAAFILLINSFVHIVMYTYYLLAGLGPKFKKYLTWKKQITQLQLVQFVIILIYNLQALPRECDYPKMMHVFQIVESLIFIYMFSSFYVKAYNTKKPIDSINASSGYSTFKCLINSFVHVIMHTYYLLAGLGQNFKSIYPGKIQALPRKYDYPKFLIVLGIIEGFLFIYLFTKFYTKTYHNTNKSKGRRDTNGEILSELVKSLSEKTIN